jgi:hypothetical protein
MPYAVKCWWWTVYLVAPLDHHTMIKWTQIYTSRPWSGEYGDALSRLNQVGSEKQMDTMIQFISRFTPRSTLNNYGYSLAGRTHVYVEAGIVRVQSYTHRLGSSKHNNAVRGHDWVSLVMKLEAIIEHRCSYTGRLLSREFRNVLRSRDGACFSIQLDAMIVRYCTPYSYELGDTFGSCDWVTLEMHCKAAIEQVWRCTWRPWTNQNGGVLWGSKFGGGSQGGRHNGSWNFIDLLNHNCGNIENWVQHGLPRAEGMAGSGRQSMLGWCSMWCIQYSVCAVLGVSCTLYTVISECCTHCMIYSVVTLDHSMEK